MQQLTSGRFFGTTNQTLRTGGLVITDTEYTHGHVDWHFHENPYLTFILQGRVIEGNKKEVYDCGPGTLLFHNWQEAHYNSKPPGFTRGFHIECSEEWFSAHDISIAGLKGSLNIADPAVKTPMYHIFREAKLCETSGSLAFDALLVGLFDKLGASDEKTGGPKPVWVNQIRELLHESRDTWKLSELAAELDIHPVHLSRDFSKHFKCHLGDYIRAIKLQRAIGLLPQAGYSLTAIALECGFSDQSHFIRCFKACYHITPLQYRRLLHKKR